MSSSPDWSQTGAQPADAKARFVWQRVQSPATWLFLYGVVATITGVLQLLGFAATLAVIAGQNGAPNNDEMPIVALLFGSGLLTGATGAISGVLAILGGRGMKVYRRYSTAMLAALLAMLPCSSPCCLIGIPIGLWVVLVLRDAEVRDAFALVQHDEFSDHDHRS